MEVARTVEGMRQARRQMVGSVGFVPTMGYLHEGHLSLIRRARAENDVVVVSIFVNPAQFGPREDYERYPRDETRDLALLEKEGVEKAFLPTVEEMYPPQFDAWVEVKEPVAQRLEEASRPGYFRGVTTIVARLFDIVRPERAYFGEKDAQQLRVVRRLVSDMSLPVEVVGCPTVREKDGLAVSSRNVYLSTEGRQAAIALPRALELARALVIGRGLRDAELVREGLQDHLRRESQVEIDYVSVADAETLEELSVIDRPALVLLAAWVGGTRLIDNVALMPVGVPLA